MWLVLRKIKGDDYKHSAVFFEKNSEFDVEDVDYAFKGHSNLKLKTDSLYETQYILNVPDWYIIEEVELIPGNVE